jgi:hypothetical protein
MSEPKRGTVFDRADLTAHKRVLGVPMGIQALFSIWVEILSDFLSKQWHLFHKLRLEL